MRQRPRPLISRKFVITIWEMAGSRFSPMSRSYLASRCWRANSVRNSCSLAAMYFT